MRVETAMGPQAAYGYSDVHDAWAVAGGLITAEMSAEAKRLGAEVWTYSHRILGSHPLRNRYYAGLYTWAHTLKGNWIWCYSDLAIGGYNASVWWRDDDEPQPMVGWEARREGIDDYCYLQMLEETVATRAEHPLAAEAGAWLETLRPIAAIDPHVAEVGRPLAHVDYDDIRTRAAEYIERLGPVSRTPERFAAETTSRSWNGLKDEARTFRD